jgi:predicted glycosyltransferase
MKIWIDLDNSPHVLFFAPLIRMLEQDGVEVLITARDFSQTIQLARAHGLRFVTVGEHRTPHHLFGRVAATAGRTLQLARRVRNERPHAAINHGSRAQVMAARMLGIPVMTLYDYEFVSAGIFSRLAQRVLVPDCLSLEGLRGQGLDIRKYSRYPGLKEEVYVYDFQPDERLFAQLGLDPARLIVTVRPQANWAHYHHHHSEELFIALIERLREEKDAQVLLLPRTQPQREELRIKYGVVGAPFQIVETAIDGLNLMFYSDAVFSGGGTMAREAALLGVNVYSFFAGKLGAADQMLAAAGKLKMLSTAGEVHALRFQKARRNMKLSPLKHSGTKEFVFRQIRQFAASY